MILNQITTHLVFYLLLLFKKIHKLNLLQFCHELFKKSIFLSTNKKTFKNKKARGFKGKIFLERIKLKNSVNNI